MAADQPRPLPRRLRGDCRPGSAALRSRRGRSRPCGERRRPRPRRAPDTPAPPPAARSRHRSAEEPLRAAHYQQLRQEVLKTKMGKLEKITVAHSQPSHNLHKCELNIKQKIKCNTPLNKIALAKRNDLTCRQDSKMSDAFKQKSSLHCIDNLSDIKLNTSFFFSGLSDKEISYAGAKFSDPPSPSVLPKPPRHWVGTTTVQRSQQCKVMAVHLKTLLKVQV